MTFTFSWFDSSLGLRAKACKFSNPIPKFGNSLTLGSGLDSKIPIYQTCCKQIIINIAVNSRELSWHRLYYHDRKHIHWSGAGNYDRQTSDKGADPVENLLVISCNIVNWKSFCRVMPSPITIHPGADILMLSVTLNVLFRIRVAIVGFQHYVAISISTFWLCN